MSYIYNIINDLVGRRDAADRGSLREAGFRPVFQILSPEFVPLSEARDATSRVDSLCDGQSDCRIADCDRLRESSQSQREEREKGSGAHGGLLIQGLGICAPS